MCVELLPCGGRLLHDGAGLRACHRLALSQQENQPQRFEVLACVVLAEPFQAGHAHFRLLVRLRSEQLQALDAQHRRDRSDDRHEHDQHNQANSFHDGVTPFTPSSTCPGLVGKRLRCTAQSASLRLARSTLNIRPDQRRRRAAKANAKANARPVTAPRDVAP